MTDSPFNYTVALPRAQEHLRHVVQEYDTDAIPVAIRHVRRAQGTLDFTFYDDRWTPLTWVVWAGNLECTRLLLEAGANPNYPMSKDNTALHRAVTQQLPEMVELLVRFGANADHANTIGKTPRDLISNPTIRVVLEHAELTRSLAVLSLQAESQDASQDDRGRRRL